MHYSSPPPIGYGLKKHAESALSHYLSAGLREEKHAIPPRRVTLPTEFAIAMEGGSLKMTRHLHRSDAEWAQVTRRLEQRERQQAAIAKLGLMALSGTDLSNLGTQAVHSIRDKLGVDFVAIFVLDVTARVLRLETGVGWTLATSHPPVLPAHKNCLLCHALRVNHPIIALDLQSDPRLSPAPLLVDHKVASAAACIIPGEPNTYGVLAAMTVRKREFSQDDVHFLQSIANVIASTHAQQQAQHTIAAKEKQLRELNQTLQQRVHTRALELKDREAWLQAMVETAVDAIVAIDDRGIIHSFNPAAQAMFGYAEREVLGNNVSTLMPSPHREAHDQYIQRYMAGGAPSIIGIGRDIEAQKKDGSVFPVHLSVSQFEVSGKLHFCGVIRDLTRERMVEEQLEHVKKIEAIGTLASGIAHDFNNLLMGIAGCANMALRKIPKEHAACHHMEEILAAAKRGTAVTRQLLNFSRKQSFHVQPINLPSVLRDLQPVYERLVGENISMRLSCASEQLFILADPAQIEQILLNLLTNARDAMPTGGSLCIRVHPAHLSQQKTSTPSAIPPGDYAVLGVQDTGTGIDVETQKRLFEPFFTTKEPDKGTGLGLSTVYSITSELHGYIEVDSSPDKGTTFSLYFPLIQPQSQPSRAKETTPSPTACTNNHTVLIVEDESLVRLTVAHFLRELGYKVLEAATPAEALKKNHSEKPIDILVTDVMMPHMEGQELAQQLRKLRPNLGVVFMSAFPKEDLVERDRIPTGATVLTKPFSQEDLDRAILGSLNRKNNH